MYFMILGVMMKVWIGSPQAPPLPHNLGRIYIGLPTTLLIHSFIHSMQVAKLESCHNCQRLTSMVSNGPHMGKKAEKNRKALEAWSKTTSVVLMTEDVTM